MSLPVVLFFPSLLNLDFALQSSDELPSYSRLAEFALQKNIDLRFVFDWKNFKVGLFNKSWRYQDQKYIQVTEPFTAEVTYIRERIKFAFPGKRVNNSFLEIVCRDKYATAQTFPDFCKKTLLVTNKNLEKINKLSGPVVVLKPRFGSEGRQVLVLPKEKITKEVLTDEDYIAQEFIDSSAGISDLVSGRHEMRLYIFNGQIQSAYFRIPASDSFLANISRGGSELLFDNEKIPTPVRQLVSKVDDKFKDITPRLYTIDVMFENEKPWIVELNDTPGMPDVAVQPLTDNYLHDLLDLLSEKY